VEVGAVGVADPWMSRYLRPHPRLAPPVSSSCSQVVMDRPYVPISCEFHDRLLASATLGEECELEIGSDVGVAERIRGVIADVYSRGGAEYLRLDDGRTLRLDRIRALNGRPMPSVGPGR
jgi:Rho-binding antiterminator